MAWQTGPVEPEKVEKTRKARNPRKPKVNKEAEALIAALDFVRGAIEDDEAEASKYVKFANGWVTAYDGVSVAAGFPVQDEMTCCPHYARLRDAVGKSQGTLALSLSDGGRLMVTAEKLKAVVPCLPLESFPPVFPDIPIATIDDRLKEGFAAVIKLANPLAETIHESTILLRAGSMIGCNGKLALEYWHGIDLPPGLAIPHRAAKMLSKMPVKMERFGFTPGRSATFFFEGGAWVRTQLHGGEWPNMDNLLNVNCDPVEMPGFFEAVEAVAPFSEDGALHFHNGKLKSTYAASNNDGPIYGASWELPGLIAGTIVSAPLIKLAKHAMHKMDYQTYDDRILFFSEDASLRGILMKRR